MNENYVDLKKYNIPCEPVPRFTHGDPRIDEYISENKPVIISDCVLAKACLHWSVEYLTSKLPNAQVTVYSSPSGQYKYYDEKKAESDWVPPFQKTTCSFAEFNQKLTNGEQVYLQHSLASLVSSSGGVGGLARDFSRLGWSWARATQRRHAWGALTNNLLLIAQQHSATPVHYDEQHNLFAQLTGRKRFLLFSPAHYDRLYPYPVYHPHDRQSQVDLTNVDLTRFPLVPECVCQEAFLSPGDVLHIPAYWWHHVHAVSTGGHVTTGGHVSTGDNVSVTWWHVVPAACHHVQRPLAALPAARVTLLRNVERLLLEAAAGDTGELPKLIRALALGRYVHYTETPRPH